MSKIRNILKRDIKKIRMQVIPDKRAEAQIKRIAKDIKNIVKDSRVVSLVEGERCL